MHLSWPLRPGEADNKADKLVGPRYTKCRGFHHSLSVMSLMKCMSKAWRRRHNAEFYSIIRRDRGAVMIVANKKCQLTSAFVMRIIKATKVSKYSWKLYRKYVIMRSHIVSPTSVAKLSHGGVHVQSETKNLLRSANALMEYSRVIMLKKVVWDLTSGWWTECVNRLSRLACVSEPMIRFCNKNISMYLTMCSLNSTCTVRFVCSIHRRPSWQIHHGDFEGVWSIVLNVDS